MAKDTDDSEEINGEDGLVIEGSEGSISDDEDDVYQHLLNPEDTEAEIEEEEPTDDDI